jgi:hypothetical protein
MDFGTEQMGAKICVLGGAAWLQAMLPKKSHNHSGDIRCLLVLTAVTLQKTRTQNDGVTSPALLDKRQNQAGDQ